MPEISLGLLVFYQIATARSYLSVRYLRVNHPLLWPPLAFLLSPPPILDLFLDPYFLLHPELLVNLHFLAFFPHPQLQSPRVYALEATRGIPDGAQEVEQQREGEGG